MPLSPKAGQRLDYQRLRQELGGLARSINACEAGILPCVASPIALWNRMVSQATTKELAFAGPSHPR
jgi:hypothetical protein